MGLLFFYILDIGIMCIIVGLLNVYRLDMRCIIFLVLFKRVQVVVRAKMSFRFERFGKMDEFLWIFVFMMRFVLIKKLYVWNILSNLNLYNSFWNLI
jgi:hypothetical protein